jgi:hypothetical protein
MFQLLMSMLAAGVVLVMFDKIAIDCCMPVINSRP